MTDRLSEMVLVLQRMGDNARMRGDDLQHVQNEERREHAWWLDQQLKMAEEVVEIFRTELRKFVPQRPQQIPSKANPSQANPSQALPEHLRLRDQAATVFGSKEAATK